MVPTASFEVNYSGPTVKSGYSSISRTYTAFEQIYFLIEKLNENKQIAEARWNGRKYETETQPFRLEICLACKLILADPNSSSKLVIWVSRYSPHGKSETPTTLILLEGIKHPDSKPAYISAYSLLFALFGKSTPKFFPPLLAKKMGHGAAFSWKELSVNLHKNPIGFLKSLGAEVLAERCIQTLYRVRDACIAESPFSIPTVVTIGHPIFIRQSSMVNLISNQNLYLNNDEPIEISREQMNVDIQVIRDMLKESGMNENEVEIELKNLNLK